MKSLSMVVFLLLTCAGVPSMASEMKTRFGNFEIRDDNIVLFKGRPLSPAIEGNSSLNFVKKFAIGSSDIVILKNVGGSSCPYLYFIVEVSARKIITPEEVGTCAEATQVFQQKDGIVLSMPGFQGPFEAEAGRRRAAKERHVFLYKAGIVTENGKPV